MKEIINTEKAPKPVGPYSQAIRAGNMIFCSGQIPINPETGKPVDGGIEEQTAQVIENLKAVIEEAGCTLDDVVKCTVFLKDMNNFKQMNSVYDKYFGNSKPARAAVEVSRLPLDVMVEIEAVLVKS